MQNADGEGGLQVAAYNCVSRFLVALDGEFPLDTKVKMGC